MNAKMFKKVNSFEENLENATEVSDDGNSNPNDDYYSIIDLIKKDQHQIQDSMFTYTLYLPK